VLGLDLLAGGQQRVGAVGALTDADGHIAGARLDAQHGTGENFMLLGGEALKDHAPLRLADALNDDLLGRLRRNAAEGLRLNFDIDKVALLCVGVDLAGGVQRDLRGGGDDLVDDLLLGVHLHFLLGQLDENVVRVAVLVLFIGRDQRLRDTLDHVIHRDAALFFQLAQSRKNLSVRVHVVLLKIPREAAPERPPLFQT